MNFNGELIWEMFFSQLLYVSYSVCICVRVYMCIYMYICIYVCKCIYVYTCIYILYNLLVRHTSLLSAYSSVRYIVLLRMTHPLLGGCAL